MRYPFNFCSIFCIGLSSQQKDINVCESSSSFDVLSFFLGVIMVGVITLVVAGVMYCYRRCTSYDYEEVV